MINHMFRWWRLIIILSALHKLPVYFILWLGRGMLAHNRVTKESKYIAIPFLPTKETLLIYLHELGHHLSPTGKDKDIIKAELSAWKVAFQLMKDYQIPIRQSDYAKMRSWFSSYAFGIGDPQKAFVVLGVFDNLFIENYINRET